MCDKKVQEPVECEPDVFNTTFCGQAICTQRTPKEPSNRWLNEHGIYIRHCQECSIFSGPRDYVTNHCVRHSCFTPPSFLGRTSVNNRWLRKIYVRYGVADLLRRRGIGARCQRRMLWHGPYILTRRFVAMTSFSHVTPTTLVVARSPTIPSWRYAARTLSLDADISSTGRCGRKCTNAEERPLSVVDIHYPPYQQLLYLKWEFSILTIK